MNRSIDRLTIDTTSGFGLKVRRQAMGIQARAIARLMGVSRARVATIEAARFPTRAARERYLDALRCAVRERQGPHA